MPDDPQTRRPSLQPVKEDGLDKLKALRKALTPVHGWGSGQHPLLIPKELFVPEKMIHEWFRSVLRAHCISAIAPSDRELRRRMRDDMLSPSMRDWLDQTVHTRYLTDYKKSAKHDFSPGYRRRCRRRYVRRLSREDVVNWILDGGEVRTGSWTGAPKLAQALLAKHADPPSIYVKVGSLLDVSHSSSRDEDARSFHGWKPPESSVGMNIRVALKSAITGESLDDACSVEEFLKPFPEPEKGDALLRLKNAGFFEDDVARCMVSRCDLQVRFKNLLAADGSIATPVLPLGAGGRSARAAEMGKLGDALAAHDDSGYVKDPFTKKPSRKETRQRLLFLLTGKAVCAGSVIKVPLHAFARSFMGPCEDGIIIPSASVHGAPKPSLERPSESQDSRDGRDLPVVKRNLNEAGLAGAAV